MKSRCCTFYKNTSERTGLCKLDTDSSALPCHSPPKASSSGARTTECPSPTRGEGEGTQPISSGQCPLPSLSRLELCSATHLSGLAVNCFFLLLLPLCWDFSGQWPVSGGRALRLSLFLPPHLS